MSMEVLKQKIDHLEKEVIGLKEEIRELDKRVDNHDTLLSKIEVIMEGLSSKWSILERKIVNVMTSTNTTWADTLREVLKTGVIIIGAILSAKIFL